MDDVATLETVNPIRISKCLRRLAHACLVIGPMMVFAVLVFARGGAFLTSRSVLWLILIAVAFIQTLRGILSKKDTIKTPLDVFVFLLCIFFGAAIFYSYSPARSWLEFNNILACALAFVLVSQAIRDERDSLLFTRTVVAVGLFFAVQSIYLAISGVPGVVFVEETRIRLLGPFGYANIFAIFLVMVIPLAVHLAAISKTRLEEACMVCVSVVLLLALGLTYSRGAILTALGVLVVMLVMVPSSRRLRYLKDVALILVPILLLADSASRSAFVAATGGSSSDHKQALISFFMILFTIMGSAGLSVALAHKTTNSSAKSIRKLVYVLASILVIYGVAFVISTSSKLLYQGVKDSAPASVRVRSQSEGERTQAQVQNLLSLSDQQQPQRIDRLWLWRLSAKSIKERPLLGTGPGTFTLRFLALRDKPREVIDPHNMYLRLLTEVGIIGFLPLAAILGVFFFLLAQLMIKSSKTEPDSPIPAYAAGVFGFLAHSAIDTEWTFPAMVMLFFIYLGVIYARQGIRNGASVVKSVLVVLVSAIAFLSVLLPLLSEQMLVAGREEMKKLHWQHAQQKFIQAKSFNPASPAAHAELAGLYRTRYHITKDSSYLKLSEKEYLEALQLDSHDPTRYLQLGEFLTVECRDLYRALGYFKKAAELDPLDPTPYLRLKDIYAALGEFEKAKQAELDGNHRNWMWSEVLKP